MDRKSWLLNYGADQVVGFSGVRFDRPVTPPRHGFTKFDSSWSVGPETFPVVIPACFSKLTGHQRGFENLVSVLHESQSSKMNDECQEKRGRQHLSALRKGHHQTYVSDRSICSVKNSIAPAYTLPCFRSENRSIKWFVQLELPQYLRLIPR